MKVGKLQISQSTGLFESEGLKSPISRNMKKKSYLNQFSRPKHKQNGYEYPLQSNNIITSKNRFDRSLKSLKKLNRSHKSSKI